MKRLLSALFAVLLLAHPALGAITFDVASSSRAAASSTSHSHTIAASANAAIVCLTMRDDSADVQPASAVTVGGAAATFLSGVTTSNGLLRTELWYKLAPATGSQTVAVTADATTDYTTTGVMTFISVAQTSTFNTPATATGDSTDVDVDSIASALGEMVAGCGSTRTVTTISADATVPVSTERHELECVFSACWGFGYTEDGAATSIDMRVDLDQAAIWAVVAVSMRPSATGGRRPVAPIIFQ